MIVDFGWNTNDGIRVNPLITIKSIRPQIISLKSGTVIAFRCSSGDGISPVNIGIFGLFYRETSDFSDRSAPWHGELKSGSETLKATIFSIILGTGIILKLKKLGTKILEF